MAEKCEIKISFLDESMTGNYVLATIMFYPYRLHRKYCTDSSSSKQRPHKSFPCSSRHPIIYQISKSEFFFATQEAKRHPILQVSIADNLVVTRLNIQSLISLTTTTKRGRTSLKAIGYHESTSFQRTFKKLQGLIQIFFTIMLLLDSLM